MHLTGKNVFTMIFYDFKSGLSLKQRIESLRAVFDSEDLCLRTVYGCYNEFKFQKFPLSDKLRERRLAASEEKMFLLFDK